MYEEITKSIKEIREIADKTNYIITHELDAGYFKDKLPWEDEEEEVTPANNISGEGIELEEG